MNPATPDDVFDLMDSHFTSAALGAATELGLFWRLREQPLACDTGRYSEAVFRKVHAALRPGGRLVIANQFAPSEGVAHPARLDWAFLASMRDPDSAVLTAAEVESRVTRAGFQVLSECTLASRKPDRWSRQWVVIEASRQRFGQ